MVTTIHLRVVSLSGVTPDQSDVAPDRSDVTLDQFWCQVCASDLSGVTSDKRLLTEMKSDQRLLTLDASNRFDVDIIELVAKKSEELNLM